MYMLHNVQEVSSPKRLNGADHCSFPVKPAITVSFFSVYVCFIHPSLQGVHVDNLKYPVSEKK